jgi:hypothetical protein
LFSLARSLFERRPRREPSGRGGHDKPAAS